YVYPNTPVPPTSAKDAEAGLKFQFFDGKLEGAVGYYDLTKTNQTEPDLNPAHVCPSPNGGFPTCVIIVGESRTKGPEVDFHGSPIPGLNLIANYTNISSALTKAYSGAITNQLGQPFAGVPRNQATASATYEIQEGTFKGLKLGATYSYTGAARVTDFTNASPGSVQQVYLGWLAPSVAGYGIVDVLAEYPFQYDGVKYSAGVNIHNLFDRTYYTGEYLQSPLQGIAYSYAGGRAIGDNFSVLGHLKAEWPGAPPPPNRKPAPPLIWAHDWSGPYAGLQVGALWGDNKGGYSYVTPDGLTDSPSLVTNGWGVLAGAHAGYNKQFEHWVAGLEGSVDVTNLDKQEVLGIDNPNPNLYFIGINNTNVYCNNSFCGGSIATHISSNYQASLRARLGYAWNRLLIYGTGGLAFSNFNLRSNVGGQDVNGNYYFAAANDRSLLQLGWTAGAGVEYAITPRWSARAEWRYSDFGHITETPTTYSALPDGPVYYRGERHLTQDQFQVGASYKFGGGDPEMFPLVSPPVFKGPALAGDLPSLKGGPVPPRPSVSYEANWTGFYLGGQAGYAYGDNHGAYNYSTPDGIVGSGALSHDAQGVNFGGHLGYNYQFDKFVLGLEGSVDGASLAERETLGSNDAAGDQGVLTSFVQSNIQEAVRARAGYAIGRLLPFVAGGLAIGNFGTQSELATANNANFAFDGFATHGLQWMTRLGWTFGGGVEWAVSPHWSIRGEYRYSDFGKVADTPNVALPGTLYSGARRLDQNQVQFGFSYKLGDPLLVAVAAAPAAPPPPPIDWAGYTWTGLYAGGQIGYLWGANHGNYYAATSGGLIGWDSLTGDAHNATVEGHIGYNKQFDRLVLGLEGSVDGGNVVRSSLLPVYDFVGGTPGGALTTAAQSTIEGSIRARIGYAFGRLSPFVSGGVTLGDFSIHSYLAGQDAIGVFNAANAGPSMLRVGWSLGAGVEYALTRSFALRGEYRYTDYGNVSDAATLGASGAYFVGTRRLDQNQLLFGVSYKFTDEGSTPVVAASAGELPYAKGAPIYAPPPSSP
ncbi:MAG TPA: outer membrane beta-barrel protein, partial [Roseiarcus sp.]|nr:outer membrane beta-barrel protein [Roseiarcus sp.]